MNYSVFDNLLNPVIVIDSNKKVVYCNDAILNFLGVSARNLKRSTSLDDSIRTSPNLIEGQLADIILATPYREIEFESTEGRKAKGQVSLQPAGDSPEELGQWIVFIKDVTLEEKLQAKYRKEMEQKQTMIEALAKTSTSLNRKLMEMAMLLRIATVTSSLGDLGVIIDTIFNELFSFFKFKYSALLLLNPEGTDLNLKAFHTNPKRAESGELQKDVLLSIDRNHELVNEVFRNESSIFYNAETQKAFFQILNESIGAPISNGVLIPVRSKGRSLGLVLMLDSLPGWYAKPEELNLMNSIVAQLGIILENSALYESSITDGLTKLHNVSYFRSVLNTEIKQTLRYGHSLSIILFDIDHFKPFNDKYGHPTGDLVLKEVAKRTRESLRTSDIAARYGGEEFAIICPATDAVGAMNVAERLRQNVESMIVRDNEHDLKVTISLGVAEVAKSGSSVESVIKAADEALYTSKGAGRNRVTLAPTSMPVPLQKRA